MSFWRSTRVKKTRKVHRCEFCGGKIDIGESCEYSCGISDGYDFTSMYLCDMCDTIYYELSLDWTEGIDEWNEFMCDAIYDVKCPSCIDDAECSSKDLEWDTDRKAKTISFECNECGHKWTADLFNILGITEATK